MREIRLTEALVPLRRSYNQAQRLVATGQIKGRLADGKWWVDADDVTRFIAREARKTSTQDAPVAA